MFYNTSGHVVSLILSIQECALASTGENILNIMDVELSKAKISWQNCISFSTDNASVMIGIHKGVAAHVHRQNPSVYIMGCPCHLMHLAAQKACKELPVKVDELLIYIYYYLDKSSEASSCQGVADSIWN